MQNNENSSVLKSWVGFKWRFFSEFIDDSAKRLLIDWITVLATFIQYFLTYATAFRRRVGITNQNCFVTCFCQLNKSWTRVHFCENTLRWWKSDGFCTLNCTFERLETVAMLYLLCKRKKSKVKWGASKISHGRVEMVGIPKEGSANLFFDQIFSITVS